MGRSEQKYATFLNDWIKGDEINDLLQEDFRNNKSFDSEKYEQFYGVEYVKHRVTLMLSGKSINYKKIMEAKLDVPTQKALKNKSKFCYSRYFKATNSKEKAMSKE